MRSFWIWESMQFFITILNLPHIACKKIQSYPLFYQQLISFWEKVSRKEPLNALEIVNQVIWNNIFLLKQSNSFFYPSLYNKGILKVNDLLDDFGHVMKWASAKLKFDLKEQDAMVWLSVLESIPSQWKRKKKSHDMKIVDDVSAGPSFKNMTVKSVYNTLLRSVKTCPTSQKSMETLLNNHSMNWPEVYMIPHKVTIETSLRVFQYKLLNTIIYLNKRIAKFDPAVNPLCSICSQAPEDIVHLFFHYQKTQQLWELLRSMLSMLHRHITLPDLEPTLAVVGKWCIENNHLIINHIVLIFKKFL